MTSQFTNPSPEYYGLTEDMTGVQDVWSGPSLDANTSMDGSPTEMFTELGPFNPITNPMENYLYHAFLATDPEQSSTTGNQSELCGQLINSPGLQAFLQLQADSDDIIIRSATPLADIQPQGIDSEPEQNEELDVEITTTAIGNATGGDEGEDEPVHPGTVFTTPTLGLSTKRYSFIWTPTPAMAKGMKTMPFWQPLPAGQVNAISGPNTSQGNGQGTEVVERIEIPERLAVMMAMTFKERKEFQIGTYGFHDLMDDLPLFKEKIIASFEPNEEEVDCPYGCPRMKVERMRYHLEGLHIPGRPKSCNLCPKKYTGYQALLDHVEGFHCDWTFTCKVCEKEVSRKDMINHFRFRCMGIWPPLPKRTEWSITADGYFTLF